MARKPFFEELEQKLLVSDFVLSGYKWASSTISYSFAPQGVMWDVAPNNLQVSYNIERMVAEVFNQWESNADIEIYWKRNEVGRNDFGVFGKSQSDPRFGDIRIGGYGFSDKMETALTYFPPPQGTTEAGDIEINTGINQPNLFETFLHETGHSLGLAHSTNPADVMYPVVSSLTQLGPGDIMGLQAMYGTRHLDAFQAGGHGTNFSNAIQLSTNLIQQGLRIEHGSTEYFRFADRVGESLIVVAAANGVSMLSPAVSLYDSSLHYLKGAAQQNNWSCNAVLTMITSPGKIYYVAVTAANEFNSGAYMMYFFRR